MTVGDIYSFLDSFAAFSSQESWDNSGLMAGNMNDDVSAVLCALDFTPETVREAENAGCSLIVNHHPALFHPAKCFIAGTDGLYEAARGGISVIASHTCLDAADGGVNDVLCAAVGLKNTVKLYPENGAAIMRAGETERQSAESFARKVSEKLGGAVRFTDVRDVQRVAVCSGSGCDYLRFAAENGYDTFLTGDASHHNFRDAENLNINLIAAGHFETERPVMDTVAEKLREKFPGLKVIISRQESPCRTVNENGA